MTDAPFFSICIPTYNRTEYLPRILDSIGRQTFKDYNIIITDNTRDNRIKDALKPYENSLPIRYHQNQPMLNMAGNWNAGFAMADGEWIKLIHDDDWLATDNALEKFAEATKRGCRFIYSGRKEYDEETGIYTPKTISLKQFDQIKVSPLKLYSDNLLGPPSVLLFHKSVTEYYDPALQWFVDIEYYIRMRQKEDAFYIGEPLINISHNAHQITNQCFNNPEIQIPELLHIFKNGIDRVDDIITYDGFWRIIRNLGIRSVASIGKYALQQPIPALFKKIIYDQKHLPQALLKFGPFSKLAMTASYFTHK